MPLATRAVYKVLFGGQIVWVGVQADGEVASGALGFFYGSGARTSTSGGGELYGSSGGPAASAGQPTEGGYVLTALNWNGNGPETLQRLIVTAHELYERRTELPVDVFVSRYGSWERIGSRISRKVRRPGPAPPRAPQAPPRAPSSPPPRAPSSPRPRLTRPCIPP